MKKVVVFTVMALLATVTGFAQKEDGLKFSLGAELGASSGSFANTYSIGLGASAQVEIPLQDKLNAVAYGGILFYNGKTAVQGTKYKGATIIPVRVGVKYFLLDGIYGAFQTGLAFYNTSNYGATSTSSSFSFSPQVGYEFKTKSDKAIDATLKYEVYSSKISTVGLRLAYIF